MRISRTHRARTITLCVTALAVIASMLVFSLKTNNVETAAAAPSDMDARSQAVWDQYESESDFSPSAADEQLLTEDNEGAANDLGGVGGGEAAVDLRWAQRRLLALGYWHSGVDGKAGLTTSQAIMAFQKVNGLARDGVLGSKTAAALGRATRPKASGRVVNGIEVSKATQVLYVVRNRKVIYVINVSTGSNQWYTQDGVRSRAVTPSGSFRVFRQIDRMHKAPLGYLFRPKYFNGGIAIHGAASIPGYPASHGCVRVSNPAMNLIWRQKLAEIGSRVVVY